MNLKELTGNEACEGNYIAADDAGNLYLTANLGNGNKGDCVLKISENGKKADLAFECAESYGISIAQGYIFVSTYEADASHVYAYEQNGYKQVLSLNALPQSDNYAGIVYLNGCLYVTDQGYNGGARLLRTSALIK